MSFHLAYLKLSTDLSGKPTSPFLLNEGQVMKEHSHLTPDQVETLLSGSLSPEAVRLAMRLLLAGCPVCLETVRLRVLGPGDPGLGSRPEAPAKPLS